MLDAELSPAGLASAVGVDVKSVTRWLAEECVPYPTTRMRIARHLKQRESFLWPALAHVSGASEAALAELDRVWPTRSAVPSETWHALFEHASARLDILVYAGGFLIETLDLADVLRWKAGKGTVVRVLVGDPSSVAVKVRAEELSMTWLPERCWSTARYLDSVRADRGVNVRCHDTTLYASTFRFDDVLLVNTHVFGVWAAQSPTLQLRQSPNANLFDFYASAFERVWASGSRPADR